MSLPPGGDLGGEERRTMARPLPGCARPEEEWLRLADFQGGGGQAGARGDSWGRSLLLLKEQRVPVTLVADHSPALTLQQGSHAFLRHVMFSWNKT